MNSRAAKRRAAGHLAEVANGTVALIEERYRLGEHWEGLGGADARRVQQALRELSQEMRRRANGERGAAEKPARIDPAQGVLFEED